MRVLVCDDNADAADTLALLLRAHGHDVKVFYEGRACVREALEWRPSVAFLDIEMPEISGYAVARQLRVALGAAVLLVAVTGYIGSDDKSASLEAGFDTHLTKPAPLDRVLTLAATASRPGPD
jgi:CheY-like chemotaxis protein